MIGTTRRYNGALVTALLALCAPGFAQVSPTRSSLMPVSRLSGMNNVRWAALNANQKSALALTPTLTENGARLKLVVPGYEMTTIQRERTSFLRVDVPGSGVTPSVGRPEIPVVRRFVVVPEGARVSYEVKTGQPKVMSNVCIYPVQEPLPEDNSVRPTEMKFAFEKEFYKQAASYPANLVTVSEPMKLRNLDVVMVEIATMQYHGANSTLTVYPDLEVNLSFSKPFVRLADAEKIKINAPRLHSESLVGSELQEKNLPGADIQVKNIPALRNDKLFVNWDWVKDHKFRLKWDYLIITPDSYYCEVQPLADWKRDKGLAVRVAKLSQISATPTPEQIRDYIKTAYDIHGVDYVLLVGDTNTLPGYTFTNSSGISTISDYYYSLVSGNDYLPDVALGRLSGRTDAEISQMVSKAVKYEKSPVGGAWKSHALCISDAGYFEDTSNYNYNNLVAHGFTTDRLYASLGNATAANTAAAINNGRLLVSYRGHGSQTSWATTGFSNADVNALKNGGMLPVIISPTCLTGCYDFASSDCYSESWTKAYGSSAPMGAVAYWGSARISYGGYNDELSKGAFDDYLAGDRVIGDVVNNAKLHMISHYGTADATSLLELHMFNLFGDPELHVK